jgi:branched-chain amino acid transport system ATP-binding protein
MDQLKANNKSCLLEVKGVSKHFRGLRAVDNYHLKVWPSEIIGIIGPNGAGKSTVFNLLTGHIHPDGGTITFRGKNITAFPPHRISFDGMGRTFQNIRLFQSMTVLENVVCAGQLGKHGGFFDTLFSTPAFRKKEATIKEEALRMLSIFNLADKMDVMAIALSYGDQRKLEIVRALALEPKLLLLDEPVAGMNQGEKDEMLALIRRIREEFSLAVVIIEHNMPVIMNLCERIQVLSYGQLIAEGLPQEIQNNKQVIESYLGQEDEDA